MRYITPSILLALLTLAGVLLFLCRYASSIGGLAAVDPGWVRGEPERLTFAGKRYPMERKDRLPVLIITLVYALTAFFQLGDLHAPTQFTDLSGGESVTIQISGSPVRAQGIRYYTGLGTGGYNVEVSTDAQRWSTLWQKKDDPEDADRITGWYWADAQDYKPSYALTQKYNQLFKWEELTLDNPIDIQYIRLTGKPDYNQEVLELGRFALLDEEGRSVPFNWGLADGSASSEELSALFYAGDVPEKSTWHNSTYFDEIYHARTAKEHIDGVYPYEVTHPPLGKLILGIGIRLFGMTPFGWRFMGTLFGVLMLPILYLFLKNMFGKTPVAACGTILFAAEFMHLTQTRIATIDTYAVFFILCMYFFMYRYLTLPAGAPLRNGALPLFLSGLMWALGISSKWTVIYGGLGLAAVYFIGFYQKLRDWPADEAVRARRRGWIAATLFFSVLCFILIPLVIYTLSYVPYAQPRGVEISLAGLGENLGLLFRNVWDKLSGADQAEGYRAIDIPRDSLTGIMANNQWYMLTYHQGVSQAHPYSSRWFQWIVDARPILYYMDNLYEGSVMTHTVRFAAFSNPVVCWTGLGAMVVCAAHTFRRSWAKAAFLAGLGGVAVLLTYRAELGENGVFSPELPQSVLIRNWVILALCLLLYLGLCAFLVRSAPGHSGKAAFILIAYLSQLAPWWLISRTTFEYHYFPSILFLVFALSYLFDGLVDQDPAWRGPVWGLTGASMGLYALFYPVLIGLTIPAWYEPLVKWIESWPF